MSTRVDRNAMRNATIEISLEHNLSYYSPPYNDEKEAETPSPQQVHGTPRRPPLQVFNSPPSQQIMPGTPRRPPSVGRRELVQQRLDEDVDHDQLARQLRFENAEETPSRPVQRVNYYPIQDLIRSLKY